MGRVVLVTGVCRDLGGRYARRIAAHPDVDRVIGVDVVPPRRDLGDVRFVRADIRNPVIAKVIAAEDVDTVVHLNVIATPSSGGHECFEWDDQLACLPRVDHVQPIALVRGPESRMTWPREQKQAAAGGRCRPTARPPGRRRAQPA